jgi:serine/threonine protein kinase/Tol biopolymer transport system component
LATAFQDRYRLEREIGAGGMATVYLAHDLRHDRKVAIKVLHAELAAAIGAERFLAEIKVTANLQHPHILPLHDSGMLTGLATESGAGSQSVLYYVMPFVQGESLRDRLNRERQLPIPDALAIARDVAAALDYAHRKGVIHRDIKPENILLHEGRPLVADFGIALAVSAAGTARMTHTGLSLGTPQYMSPEQAMGERSLDARTDVYALGAVLYEMLTGEPPFTGASVQAIVAKIMTERPAAPSTVRDTVAPYVEDAVLTALAKLPADRFASASAFAAALAQPSASHATFPGRRAAPNVAPSRWRRTTAAIASIAALMLIALALIMRDDPSPPPSPVMRFEVPLPDSLEMQKIVLTPDGTRLLVSTNNHGPFVYTFADRRLVPLEIPGGKAIQAVDVTPDGTTLVFLEGRVLKTMPIGGGPVRTLGDSLSTVRVGDDGYVYGRRFPGMRRVSLQTGTGERLMIRDSARFSEDSLFGEVGEPIPVPGGRGVVFAIGTYAPAAMQIYVLDLQTGAMTPVPHPQMETALPIGISPTGHLLFRGADAVYAIRFDAKRLRAQGTPELVLSGMPAQAVSCEGTIDCTGEAFNAQTFAFVTLPMRTPALVNRRGERRSLPNIPRTLEFHDAQASPDGRMLAHQVLDNSAHRQDIWTYRMPDGPLTRLTSGEDAFFWAPRWTADGKSIRFSAVRKGGDAIYTVPRDGSRPAELFLKRAEGFYYTIAQHPDGRRVASNACIAVKSETQCADKGRGLVVLTVGQPDSVLVIADQRSRGRSADFSPDGRWLAYTARDVNRDEVYVHSLDGRGTRWQVSRSGGGVPRWSSDGRQLFFMANDSMYAAEWRPGTEQPVGAVRALFRLGMLGGSYDVLPGDSTFVMLAPHDAERTHVVVIANFVEQLRARPTSLRRPRQ